jgi:hypothetical protein
VDHSTTENFNNYGFSGWDLAGAADASLATFFAIVVGFEALATSDTVDVNSISLVHGDIPCRPNPKTPDITLFECERFYEKSYKTSVLPGATGANGQANQLIRPMLTTLKDSGNNMQFGGQPFGIEFKNQKRTSAPIITLYSVNSGDSAKVFSYLSYADASIPGGASSSLDLGISSWISTVNDKSVSYQLATNVYFGAPTIAIGSSADRFRLGSAGIKFHYVADARLGIV